MSDTQETGTGLETPEIQAAVIKRRRKPKPGTPTAAVTEALVQAQVSIPTISFFTDVTAQIKGNARAEIDEIELQWERMRTRWQELQTLCSSIDAAQAVMTGGPAYDGPDIAPPAGTLEALEARLRSEGTHS